MKRLKTFFLVVAGVGLMASCLDNDSYNAGILFERPQQINTPLYANTVQDSIIMFSYGNWAISSKEGQSNQWVDITLREGRGNRTYIFPVNFQQNLTGEGRSATFTIEDTEHPDKAHSSFSYQQFATRGDGSLGTAADVKSITGSDGSRIELSYDAQHRPTAISMSKGESALCNLSFSYEDQKMTIYDGNSKLAVACSNSYQPGNLAMENDTMRYLPHYYLYYIELPFNEVFSYAHSRHTGDNLAITYKLHGQSLQPDSLHCADSLTYYVNDKMVEDFAIDYSTADNRRQSVDVNQLLLGIERCDPYLLLGLYRYARNTSIISRAKKPEADVTVTTTLNDNKSVASMTVSRYGESVTYTFEY